MGKTKLAPAIASFFPEEFLNFNGCLKSPGVKTFFDVSFGAELSLSQQFSIYRGHYLEKKSSIVYNTLNAVQKGEPFSNIFTKTEPFSLEIHLGEGENLL